MVSEISFPTKILIGPGALAELPAQLSRLEVSVPLVVTDGGVVQAGLYIKLQKLLAQAGVEHALFADVQPNPTEEDCLAGLEAFRRAGADSIVALGGGSPLDAAKMIRLLATHPPPLSDYDDVAGGGDRIGPDLPPMVAIPTTAGTGSEVSRSAVATLKDTGRKTVIFSPFLIPNVALCDPDLTVGLPPGPTAATGMDAFVHCAEAYCATGFHPLADAIALDGLSRVARSLTRAVEDGRDLGARTEMMVAAIMGAVAFQKGLGACHSLAHALTPICGVHHGLANAIVIPHVMAFNRPAIPDRLARIAIAMGASPASSTEVLASASVERVAKLARSIGIPEHLREVGLQEEQIPEVAAKAFQDGCHLLNPRKVTQANLEAICRAAF
jgi:4-hydroxybutyrate dehydrogenase